MMEVFDEVVGPAARRFNPDIILVGAIYMGTFHQG